MSAQPKVLDGLFAIDAELARHGVPALSPWWRAEAEAFYLHPTAREWVAAVGRGGAKSHAIVKCSLAETLYGEHEIPPGERHYFGIVSAAVDEAAKTLAIAERYLRMLGVKIGTVGEAVELREDPSRGIKVLASRVGAVSGFRCFGWAADENAKWTSNEVNPSAEVVASIRAMSVTHREARGRMFSSPVARTGHHYETWSKGTTDRQVASHAATWVANPSVTEAHTRELEPDERKWKREYLAEAQAAAMAAFDEDAVERAFKPWAALEPHQRVMIIDASSGRKDTWAWGSVGWNRDPSTGRGYVKFDSVDGLEGRFWRQTSAADVVRRVVSAMDAQGITHVHGDQRESFALASLFEARGKTFHVHDWTAPTKARAVETVRRWLADSMLALPAHAKLRRELLEFEEKITASGGFRYEARGNGHDDYVALVITAAMAELEGGLVSDVYDLDDRWNDYLPRMRC